MGARETPQVAAINDEQRDIDRGAKPGDIFSIGAHY
jgi:hypothetical protein